MREKLSKIRITAETKKKLKKLAEKKKLKQITVLEYLLSKKIKLEELNY